jgi:hypothetical protein
MATVLIAAALPQLELKPGLPLPAREESQQESPSPDLTPRLSVSINTFMVAVVEIILIFVTAYSVYKLIKGVPWREILGPSLVVTVLFLAVVGVLFALLGRGRTHVEPIAPEILPPVVEGPPLGPLPSGLIELVWIGLAVGIVLLGIWVGRRSSRHSWPGDPVELEAEQALQALRAGSDLKNVIVRCYLQMSQALQKEQGIELKETATAREFERLLKARGIPHAPVHQLTQLFEVARYGYRQPGPADEQAAFECLNAIVQYSRERKQAG